jgi:signal transduction histidine kinase
VRVRAAAVARAAVLAVAVALIVEPPVFFVALLVAPLLIEPVLYDNDRIGMALSGVLLAGVLAVLFARAPDGVSAASRYLAACALATGLPAGLGWVAAFHRERVVELTARLRGLDSTVGRLARANREFQAYAGTVRSESAAEERSRITRELHDTVGYALTNVIVMMDAAKARAHEAPESLGSLLDDVRDQSERALNDTRRILHLMRSVEQFERKGIGAIFQLTRAFQDAMGVSVELHPGNLPPTLGHRIDSALFRLVQEGLTNAFRHGNASRVRITLWQAPAEIRVRVWDNGGGLPADGTAVQDGIGMSGMRERFAELGGTVSAGNVADGFQLSGAIPYAMGEIGESEGADGGPDQGSDSG